MPITHDGHVIGAIGVSGATSADEDQELAVIGVDAAIAAAQNGYAGQATFFSSESVEAKFQTGGLLLDSPLYKLDAGRRVAPGEVEYHDRDIDIMYVVEGTATVVTGGEMIDERDAGGRERRARAIKGGTTHDLSNGDVLAIPNRVPHHFTASSDPFLYFVVKVEA